MILVKHGFTLILALVASIGFWGIGRLCRRALFKDPEEDRFALVFDFAIGAWLTWTVIFFLGLFWGYRQWIAWILLGSSALLGGLQLIRLPLRPGNGFTLWLEHRSRYDQVLLLLCVAMTSLALLGALTPPAAQDALVHHLAVPKLFIEAGHWMELPYNHFSYFPAGMEMLFLYGLLVQGPGMATLLHWCFGLATFVAILEGGRVLGIGLRGRLIAGAAFLTVPTVWMEMTWAYVDLALTFYVTLTMLALLRFRQDPSRMSWLYLAGFALGGALSLKYTALVFLFILPPLVFLVLRETKRARGWKAAELSLAPIAIALAVSCPWFIRNIVWTGNPVFPFFVGLIPSNNPGWDAERSRILWTVLGRYGGEQKTLVDYVLVPLKLSFQASYESDRHYQGVVGAFYLLSLPLLLVVRRLAVPARYLLGFATCYYLFWLFSSQQVRYLLPVLPSLALAIASAGDLLPVNAQRRIREGLKRGTLALVSAIFLFNAAHLRIRSARAGTPAAIA